MKAPFLEGRAVRWETVGRGVRGTIDGVTFRCEPRWTGAIWKVTAEAPFVVPEQVIVFVSEKGMEHGYWRDLLVGDRRFDRRFFVFCDTPALLSILLGPSTRAAFTVAADAGDELTLHIRGGRAVTAGQNTSRDAAALDRHLAIHRAVAEDHRAWLEAWRARIVDLAGRADAAWPPTATLLRPAGALILNLTWTAPTTRDAADWTAAAESLQTEITAYDSRARSPWSLTCVEPTVPCTHVVAGTRVALRGKLGVPLRLLESVYEQAPDIRSIAAGADRVVVKLLGMPTPPGVEHAVRIIETAIDPTIASTSPYR